MTSAHRTPRVSLSGRPLLLGDHHPAMSAADVDPDRGIDVVLVPLTGLEPEAVARLVAEVEAEGHCVGVRDGSPPAMGAALRAGVGLVVLDVAQSSGAEIRAVVESGAVTVLRGDHPTTAVVAIDALTAAGVDTARVVVEVGPSSQVVDQVEVLGNAAYGFRVGANLALGEPLDATGPTGHRAHEQTDDQAGHETAHEAHDGWEIGVLTAVLSLGVATVRGVDARRFHRVRAVLDALDTPEPPG